MADPDVAQAFSRHDFPATYPHIAADVRWRLVGDREITGKDALIAACTESAGFLADVTTTFTTFRVVVGAGSVVVDSTAEYAGADGSRSVVASCDIYDFVDGLISGITSYTVELS